MANPTNQKQTLTARSAGNPLPNSVQVLMRRDTAANAPIALFFARVLGINSCNAAAQATVSFLQSQTVTGFNGPHALLLPIAVDVTYWNNFLASGTSPDGTKSDGFKVVPPSSTSPAPGIVTAAGDGTPEFNNLYPDKTSPGNFGLVSIGPPATDSPTYSSWITNGPSQSDLTYFGPNGLQATASAPTTISGGTGLKSTLVSDLAAIIGQPRIVPLFSSYSNVGSNTQYTISGFAGVTIVSAINRGSNITIVVQPTVVVDPTGTNGNGGSANFVYQTSPLELTR